jgi:hypothetical protein
MQGLDHYDQLRVYLQDTGLKIVHHSSAGLDGHHHHQCMHIPLFGQSTAKKIEGHRRRMMKDITGHMMAARNIDWEMEYGTTTSNLETGGSATPPATDDEGDPLETLDVHRPTQYNYSPRHDAPKD